MDLSWVDRVILERMEIIENKGDNLFVIFFDDVDNAFSYLEEIPYSKIEDKYVQNRDSTDSIIVNQIKLKNGNNGSAVVTGGKITREEATLLIQNMEKYKSQDGTFFLTPYTHEGIKRILNKAPEKSQEKKWWEFWKK